uniref:Uncharacterized protein n=1 Tax=Panagrolaimus sp. ES5 TaxID=591445 RepID=A0AC34F6A7_9BILA
MRMMSSISHSTALLSVVDSSTGKKLAECSTTATSDPSSAENSEWHKFVWTLNKDSLECNISTSEPYIVNIESSPHPRSYSVRILAVKGPRCFRDIIIQNEEPKGCPPVLRRNTFSAHNFDCGCPKSIIEKWTALSTTESTGQIAAAAAALSASNEHGSQIPLDANGVPFPLFQLGENETEITRVFPVGVERIVANGVTQATPVKPPAGFTFKANACFGFDCFNNGTCVLDTQSQVSNIIFA